MKEMPLSRDARMIFRVGVVLSVMFGSWAVLPAVEPEEAVSFVRVPGPIIVPVRVIPRARSADEVPWFSWRRVG